MKEIFFKAFFGENPILVQILGICSLLAVTSDLKASLLMGLSLTVITGLSNLLISLVRKRLGSSTRLIVQMMFISTLVIGIDHLLAAFFYQTSLKLSIYVGLIITNCIVLGRLEAFAMNHPPVISFLDGFAYGLSYSLLLIVVAIIRELLTAGSVGGIVLLQHDFVANNLFFSAPSVFIIIGLLLWLSKELYAK
jgi:Na+-transporting NADH:ubiquinone oxidoreductase subunit D